MHAWKDLSEKFNNIHLRAQTAADLSKLQPYDAPANDHQMFRNLGQRQRAGAIHDDRTVDLHAWPGRDRGPSGDNDIPGGVALSRHLDRVGVLKGRMTLQPINLDRKSTRLNSSH